MEGYFRQFLEVGVCKLKVDSLFQQFFSKLHETTYKIILKIINESVNCHHKKKISDCNNNHCKIL